MRSEDTLSLCRRYSHPADRRTGIRSDQTIVLAGPKSSLLYPNALRRVSFRSPETDQKLVLLTNNFSIPALSVAGLYRYRWQIELFFKWIKQHLRIKRFFGTSVNQCQDANLDRRLGLCAGGNHQEAARPGAQSLHNSTDLE